MATVKIYVRTDGSDNNSGSSNSASSTLSGTGAVTNATSTVDLSADTPDLSGVVAGETIRIAGETAGIGGTDIFEILTINDGADTITVTPTPASSVGSLTWAIGGSLATIQKGFDACASNSGIAQLRLVRDADHVNTSLITIDQNSGSSTFPIQVLGVNTSDVVDGTKTVISNPGAATTVDMIKFDITSSNIKVTNIHFKGVSGAGRDGIITGTGTYRVMFENCLIDDFHSDGMFITTTNGHFWLINCEIKDCTGKGTNTNGAGRFNLTAINTTFYDNGSTGAVVSGDAGAARIENCLFYGNGGDGLLLEGFEAYCVGSTFYNNTGDGAQITATYMTFYNNTFVASGAYGLNFTAASSAGSVRADYNHYSGNTTNAIFDGSSGVTQANVNLGPFGESNQEGDGVGGDNVALIFTAAGSANFIPISGSVLDRTALGGIDIGARKAADPAGTGGLLRHPGMNGGIGG